MPKFMIYYNFGYGEHEDGPVELSSMAEAEEYAYEAWRDAAESQASYRAEEYNPDVHGSEE